jgi:hypothetical protein
MVEDHQQERFMVSCADTMHRLRAMVVHLHHAGLTHRAVVRTVGLPLILITFFADFIVIRVNKRCLSSLVFWVSKMGFFGEHTLLKIPTSVLPVMK